RSLAPPFGQQLWRAENQARRFAFFVFDDLAVGGLRRVAVDFQFVEQKSIDHAGITVVGDDRSVGCRRVEFGTGGIAALLQTRRVNFGNEDDLIFRQARGQLTNVSLYVGD